MKKILYSLLSVVVVLIGAWTSGLDFTERGAPLLFTYYLSVMAWILMYTCPTFDDDDE